MIAQLHFFSYYSLLSSPVAIDDYVIKSKELGYTSVALTDYSSMYGAMSFYKSCKKHGLKPVFGLVFPVIIEDDSYDFLVLAKNDEGYRSLMHLSSRLNSNDPKIDIYELKAYLEHLYLIFYGEGGYIEQYFNDEKVLESKLNELKSIVGDYYVAISYNDAEFFRLKNIQLKAVCHSISIETVALSKIYYLNEEDVNTYKVLKGIKENKTYYDKSLVVSSGRYLRSIDEMNRLYEQDDLLNTEKIADNCNVSMQLELTSLPHYQTTNGDAKNYLVSLTRAGLRKRLDNKVTSIYAERLNKELNVIIGMHFEDYFLIVYDFVRYAKTKDIYVGPGRGSAAGSLVAYCLGITHVDPIKYDLLFERFLNPERITMPDIDLDIPDTRRQEVIEYVLSKYGKEHFAHIVTFNTLQARQVLKDVSRVMDIPSQKADQLSKSVPNMIKMNLTKAYNEYQPFKQLVESEKRLKEVYNIALRLEGAPRHTSIHAGGIVISSLPLEDVVPVMALDNNLVATQYTMEHLEELGLIKMDLLGLRNLTIIDEIVQMVKQEEPNFDIYRIPLDDQKTYQLIASANTLGVFQLESSGMKKLLRDMQPNCFEDVAATIALFRPGPMQNIPLFLKNRANQNNVTYLHKDLIPILKSTYGVIVYQEQIMQIAGKMANFSLGKADILRKAMSKKNKEELLKLKEDFIKGCISKGYQNDVAIELYELVLKFADYGFNKSHTIAYGLIAYQLAYLKTNYPLKFYQALLNSVIASESKTSEYIYEAKQAIKILPLDINYSQDSYIEEEGGIRLPLALIKNVGQQAIKAILKDRESLGEYLDYYDFVVRSMAIKLNRKIIESLIDAGALDLFRHNRFSMLSSLQEAINYADLVRIEKGDQILIDLKLVSKPIMVSVKEDAMVKSEKEKAVLGFYFSSSILNELKKTYQIDTESLVSLKHRFGYVRAFATINRIKQHRTKKGSLMAFVSVSDETSDMDLIFMPDTYQKCSTLLIKGQHILFEGNIEKEGSCIIKKINVIKPKEEKHG